MPCRAYRCLWTHKVNFPRVQHSHSLQDENVCKVSFAHSLPASARSAAYAVAVAGRTDPDWHAACCTAAAAAAAAAAEASASAVAACARACHASLHKRWQQR